MVGLFALLMKIQMSNVMLSGKPDSEINKACKLERRASHVMLETKLSNFSIFIP
jgi:hypothetical protein